MLKHLQTLGYCGTAHRRRYGRDEVKSGTSRALAGARRARAAAEHRMQYGGQLSPDASCEERSVTSCRRVFAYPFVTSGVGAPTQALLALPTPVHRRGAQTQGQRASSRFGGSVLPGSAHCAFTRGSCTTDQETVPRLLGASPGAGAYHGAPAGCCIRPVQDSRDGVPCCLCCAGRRPRPEEQRASASVGDRGTSAETYPHPHPQAGKDGGRLICHAQTQAARDLGAAAVGDPHSALMAGRSGKLSRLSLGW